MGRFVLYTLLMLLVSSAANAAEPSNGKSEGVSTPSSYAQAMAYARGEGQPRDFARAAQLFLQGAKGGHVESQYQYALLCARGDGVKQDFKAAHEWFYKAAMQGYFKASYQLGEMYAHGDGVSFDPVEATAWFWVGTTLGDAFSQKRLRVMTGNIDDRQIQAAQLRAKELTRDMPTTYRTNLKTPMH